MVLRIRPAARRFVAQLLRSPVVFLPDGRQFAQCLGDRFSETVVSKSYRTREALIDKRQGAMNPQAVPVLIAFLTVAGIAVWLLRRAVATLTQRPVTRDADAGHTTAATRPQR